MSTKDYSSKQETQVAEYLGGSVVSGSGARMQPGDVILSNWLLECKTHVNISEYVQFKYQIWKKIQIEAMTTFLSPGYIADNGSQSLEHTWAIFPGNLFHKKTKFILSTDTIKNLKNIKFNSQQLIDEIRSKNMDISDTVVEGLQLDECPVSLCHISTFQKLFGDVRGVI